MNAVRAEWTKLRTVAGPGWLLVATIALTAAVGALAANAVSCPAGGCPVDPAKVSLTGIYLGQAIVAIVAVTVVSGEYSTGMIRLTLTATPRRWLVLLAKSAVVGTASLITGALAVLASVLAGQILLDRHGIDPAHGYATLSLADGTALRAAAGSALYLALIALLSLGIAAAIRDSAVSIGVVLGLLYLFPIIASFVGDADWKRHLDQIGPMTAGMYIQATTDLRSLPLTPWEGLGILAAWAAGALLAGGLLLRLRDALSVRRRASHRGRILPAEDGKGQRGPVEHQRPAGCGAAQSDGLAVAITHRRRDLASEVPQVSRSRQFIPDMPFGYPGRGRHIDGRYRHIQVFRHLPGRQVEKGDAGGLSREHQGTHDRRADLEIQWLPGHLARVNRLGKPPLRRVACNLDVTGHAYSLSRAPEGSSADRPRRAARASRGAAPSSAARCWPAASARAACSCWPALSAAAASRSRAYASR
jgi:ABC-2 type transport system permease protein